MSPAVNRLNPALEDFWFAPDAPDGTPVRNRVLEGGRSSSKSHDAAGFAIMLADMCRLKFVCARQFQSKISESVYALLKQKIYDFGMESRFRILDTSIIHKRTGSEFLFYGLWRSIDEVKGLEGVDIMWIEEAHNLSEAQWTVLNPTLRKEGSQFWIIFNPNLATDFVWKRFVLNPPAGTLHRQINYLENPFLSETIKRVIADAEQEDPEEFAHIYLGVPRDDDDNVIIKRSWIMAAIDAHQALEIEPSGARRIGFDVADRGADKNALIEVYGPLAHGADLWKGREDELFKSATRVWAVADRHDALIVYDSIGVGAGVGSNINVINASNTQRRPLQHVGFNAGGTVYRPDAKHKNIKPNRDMFANIKAQAWWHVADRFRDTYTAIQERKTGSPLRFDPDELIFIDSNMPHLQLLIDELSTPLRDFDNAGKVKVESKKDLLKRDIVSPNLADAFIMAYAPGQTPMIIDPGVLTATSRRAR